MFKRMMLITKVHMLPVNISFKIVTRIINLKYFYPRKYRVFSLRLRLVTALLLKKIHHFLTIEPAHLNRTLCKEKGSTLLHLR